MKPPRGGDDAGTRLRRGDTETRRNGSTESHPASPRLSVSASPAPTTHHPPPDDDEPSRLARAFQAGDRTVLAALHQALRPVMAQALLRYRPRPGAKQRALPTTLERRDLDQESWLILAHLAERWRPSGGSFGGYFRVSFPWALARYVKRHSPNRRSRVVRVLGAERPDVQERLDNSSGADGREWDRDLSWLETLQDLTDRQRAVLSLHLAEGVPFTTLAQALSLTRSTTYRLYQQALKRVQSSPARVGSSTVPVDARSLNLDRQGKLVRLVRAVHDGARPDGQLPNREWLLAKTGLSAWRLRRLLGLLIEAGCIRGRRARNPGRLVYASAQETLGVVGIRRR